MDNIPQIGHPSRLSRGNRTPYRKRPKLAVLTGIGGCVHWRIGGHLEKMGGWLLLVGAWGSG